MERKGLTEGKDKKEGRGGECKRREGSERKKGYEKGRRRRKRERTKIERKRMKGK